MLGQRYRNRGATLLELLVSLSLMTLIALLSVNALGFGRAVWSRTEHLSDQTETVDSLRSRLHEWLEGAYPFDPGRATQIVFYPVKGDEGRLVFSTGLQTDGYGDELSRVELVFEPLEQQLVMRHELDRNNKAEPDFDASEHVLLRGVEKIRFEYMEPGTPNRWVSAWRRREALPLAFRMSVDFEEGDARRFHDLIVKPKITGAAWCNFDPISRGCRQQGGIR